MALLKRMQMRPRGAVVVHQTAPLPAIPVRGGPDAKMAQFAIPRLKVS